MLAKILGKEGFFIMRLPDDQSAIFVSPDLSGSSASSTYNLKVTRVKIRLVASS